MTALDNTSLAKATETVPFADGLNMPAISAMFTPAALVRFAAAGRFVACNIALRVVVVAVSVYSLRSPHAVIVGPVIVHRLPVVAAAVVK